MNTVTIEIPEDSLALFIGGYYTLLLDALSRRGNSNTMRAFGVTLSVLAPFIPKGSKAHILSYSLDTRLRAAKSTKDLQAITDFLLTEIEGLRASFEVHLG